ncbi:MAG: type III secretion fhipep protein [Chloroflexi bacterium]|nr:type III secretion fhipep protein [Chloroflexota bacterium]
MVRVRAGASPSGDAHAHCLRPGTFCAFLLKALEAAEGQTRRRKRDQAPDKLGLALKRDLLQRAVAADPEPDAFEGWLFEQIVRTPGAGPVRAMCEQIFLEYQMALVQPDFAQWLAAGAPSDDAAPTGPDHPRERAGPGDDHWPNAADPALACTCQMDHR